MNRNPNVDRSQPTAEDPMLEILKENAERVAEILEVHGETRINNPHFGLPGHENDKEVMLVSETPDECPGFVVALLRSEDEEKLQTIIDVYKVK
jgi:uncharacterized Fe-S cluster-containing protein